jgi:hypothetical protein
VDASQRLEDFRVLFAPVASDVASFVDDPADLDLADQFLGAMEMLTEQGQPAQRREIFAAAGLEDEGRAASRFELFVRIGMFYRPRGDKPHQQRYHLHPAALVGGELLARLSKQGAAAELHDLLMRVSESVDGDASEDVVADQMRKVAAALNSFAVMLSGVVAHGTLEEMLDARLGHRTAGQFDQVNHLVRTVTRRHPALYHGGVRLVSAAQRYVAAVGALVDRVTEEVAAAPDTSVFAFADPSAIETAAVVGDPEGFGRVLSDVPVDRAVPAVDLPTLVAAAESMSAVPVRRVRPERPVGVDLDPAAALARAQVERELEQQRRADRFERLLGTEGEVDLAARGDAWPQAAVWSADAMALGRDPTRPYALDVADQHDIDPDAEVNIRFWARLRRVGGEGG